MNALRRCHQGDHPDIVYLELIANSESEDYGDPPGEESA